MKIFLGLDGVLEWCVYNGQMFVLLMPVSSLELLFIQRVNLPGLISSAVSHNSCLKIEYREAHFDTSSCQPRCRAVLFHALWCPTRNRTIKSLFKNSGISVWEDGSVVKSIFWEDPHGISQLSIIPTLQFQTIVLIYVLHCFVNIYWPSICARPYWISQHIKVGFLYPWRTMKREDIRYMNK